MKLNFFSIGSLIVAIIGLIAGIIMHRAKKKLSNPDLIRLINWLCISVILCGVPYAIWIFLLDSQIIVINNVWSRIPGMILVGFFFLAMMKSAFVIDEIANKYGFKKKNN